MTGLEERLRRVLRYYDPVQPPETALAGMEPRMLTAYEPKLPAWLKEPFGPDERVFGPEQPDRDPGDKPAGWGFIACKVHQVGWGGPDDKCWCCAAGIAPLKNY